MAITHNDKAAIDALLTTKDVAPIDFPISSPQHLLLQTKFITHHTKAGLNPLVDAAAHVFSSMGKLKNVKAYRNLAKLQKELIAEINYFQEAAKIQNYSSEYILVSRFALCATLDDIMGNTSWGSQGQWEPYSLLKVFNQDMVSPDRFFIILERIIKEPAVYIDVMELMYLCLSMGYKGSYRHTEFSHNQVEKITHTLYQHIRAFRGDYSKTLSPFPVKTPLPAPPHASKASYWLIFFTTASIIMLLFIGLGYLMDNTVNKAYQALMHIGQSFRV